MDYRQTVKEIIARKLNIDIETISDNQSLEADLKIESNNNGDYKHNLIG